MNTKFLALFLSLLVHAGLIGAYFSTFATIEKPIASRAIASSVSLSMFEAAKAKPVESVTQAQSPAEHQLKPKPAKPLEKKVAKKIKPQEKKPKPAVQKPMLAKPKVSPPTPVVKPEVKKVRPKTVETPLQKPAQPTLAKQPDGLSDADRKGIEDEYKNAVRQAILKNRVYPRQARRKRQQGTSVVAFRLLKNGVIEGLRLVTSSGSELLDKAALQAVGKVQQFKRFPKKMTRQYWDFEIPVSFKLS